MIKVGFVGLGLIGARRARIVKSLGYPIAFMVDPDSARLDALDIETAVRAPSIAALGKGAAEAAEAIFVAVPHDAARDACLWAFARGAHVLCEKPMGLNPEEAEEIALAAGRAGRRFCAGFNYRYLAGVSALRDLLESGRLGDLHRLRLSMGHGGRPGMELEWKLKRARAGGGALIDPGIHLIDLARHLAGPETLRHVTLTRRFWESDVEDNCLLALRADDSGADVAIEVSLTAWQNHFLIEAQGSEGAARLTGRGGNYGPQRLEFVNRWFWKDHDARFAQDFGPGDLSFDLETHAFMDSLTGAPADGILSGADDGRAAHALVQDAYVQAAASGQGFA